ncbi:MAG: hypothetical protein LBK73_00190 [Treponema sp.]|jgi:hypothetical protein|nr:hypothetical protein [Treponema sp.]
MLLKVIIFVKPLLEKNYSEFAPNKELGALTQAREIKTAKRIRNSAERLQWLAANLLRHAGLLVEKPAWVGGKEVCLADGSEVVTQER